MAIGADLPVVNIPLFLLAVAIGAYVQAVTGFALGLLVLAFVAVLGIASIALTANVLTILFIVSGIAVVLPARSMGDVRLVWAAGAAMLPMTVVGVIALGYLSGSVQYVLKILLGLFIMGGGAVLAWRPEPLPRRSKPAGFVMAGAIGGFFAGLLGVGGPPVVYQFYRQPLPVHTIRLSLLVLFTIVCLGRLGIVAIEGDLSISVVMLGVISIPVVIFSSWLGNRFPPPLGETGLRRAAFVLLIGTGALVVGTALAG